jgi:hypothetical protein
LIDNFQIETASNKQYEKKGYPVTEIAELTGLGINKIVKKVAKISEKSVPRGRLSKKAG